MKRHDDHHLPDLEAEFASQHAAPATEAPEHEEQFSRYLAQIAHLDLPLANKIELLRVVQEIMRSFVDRAFGDDAAQLALKDGDQIHSAREDESAPVIDSEDHHSMGDQALTGAFARRAKAGRTEKETYQP